MKMIEFRGRSNVKQDKTRQDKTRHKLERKVKEGNKSGTVVMKWISMR